MKEYTIIQLQKLMDEGKTTAKELVEQYLNRIKEIDKQGPKINAIIELNPDALFIAEKLDEERKEKGARSLLHGIPIIIKDNIDTADKMMTTAGSLALDGHRAKKDAFIVQKIREAGGIILGKGNLSEWANFRSRRSSSGWSSRGRQSKNPYILDRSPCGSSSGSAIAVAANLCIAAIGTETDGSIICPSQINGIVGIKPTVGLVSRSGIVPIAHSQDTAGPMARTVQDAAILLSVISGEDEHDSSTINLNEKTPKDYIDFLAEDGLKGARIGVARNFFGFNKQVDELMEQAIKIMEKHGAILIDPTNLENIQELREPEYEVLLYEFKNDLNNYLATHEIINGIKSMEDIINFNENNSELIMPYFGQEHFIAAQEKGPLTDEKYLEALEKCMRISREEGIDKVISEHKLDAIIAPSGGPAWTIDLLNGDRFSGGSSSAAAVSGYPSITVPLGYIHDLPVGISFFSGALKEHRLLKLAYAFEQKTKVRKPPQFKLTLELP
ncbi:MAG: amidase [Candidatus Heimdallarchaeota archaeon]|nr:amidase [Candidatus Heimdallarchaeota archaeon]